MPETGVGTVTGGTVGVVSGVEVGLGVEVLAGTVGEGLLVTVGVATGKCTTRGPTHRARSSVDDPSDPTLRMSLIFCPASWLRSRSRLKYFPS